MNCPITNQPIPNDAHRVLTGAPGNRTVIIDCPCGNAHPISRMDAPELPYRESPNVTYEAQGRDVYRVEHSRRRYYSTIAVWPLGKAAWRWRFADEVYRDGATAAELEMAVGK